MSTNNNNQTMIYVIGIGSGDYENLTIKAERALKSCDVIVGYQVYTNLIQTGYPEELRQNKTFLSTPMTQEVQRCRLCFEQAREGKKTALVCSGDAGIYGMAGLMLTINQEYPDIQIEIISGVTAALSGSALLGAPLIQDFAVISLSDLLTPWIKIEKRLLAAAEADMCICLYNPSSNKRKDYLQKACKLIMNFADPATICGIAKNIGRNGEQTSICTLGELETTTVDMFTTVFIGNSQTRVQNGRIITPRGYQL